MKLLSAVIGLFILIQGDSSIIYDFGNSSSLDNWYVVNDGVMGGFSKGKISLSQANTAIFNGFVTTANNGGFSSIRYAFEPLDVSRFSKVVIRLKGDGKVYQFRVKESPYQRFSYIKNFNTSGDWETIEIPLREFYPSYRGYRLNRDNFPANTLAEIGILIGNKVDEEFRLEIASIYLE